MSEHLEFTVSEAAEKLGVSARSIINYIKHKEIDAVKVGKSWFIKGPSLDAFTKRYRFPHKSETAPENPPNPTNGVPSEIHEKETSSVASSKQQKKKKGSSFSISRLRLHELTREYLKALTPSKWGFDDNSLTQRFSELRREAVELLGAGYYSYSKIDKQRLYEQSRERVGSLLSLYYYSKKSLEESPPEDIKNLEDELIPAYSALIRKIEKSREKK